MKSSTSSPKSSDIRNATPLYRVVAQTLRQRIDDGTYPVGFKLPSHDELTREFKVSRPTVIRALLELENAGYVKPRKGSGIFVTPSPSSRIKVGLIVPGVLHHTSDTVFLQITNHIMKEAAGLGWEIVHSLNEEKEADDASTRPVELARNLISAGIQAAILAPFPFDVNGNALNHNIISEFKAAGIPLIFVDRDIKDQSKRSEYDLVTMDSFHAGYLLGRHLLKRGSRRPLFLSCAGHIMNQDIRFQGFASVFELYGLRPVFIRANNSFDREFIQSLVELHNPDAIVGDHDSTARLILTCLQQLKYEVPDQIMLAGFDNAPISHSAPIPLTTVAQPVEAIAFKVVETLRDRLLHLDLPTCTVLVQGKLIPRLSTGEKPEMAPPVPRGRPRRTGK